MVTGNRQHETRNPSYLRAAISLIRDYEAV